MRPTITRTTVSFRIGFPSSKLNPTIALARAETITIKAELNPEALPASGGPAFTIAVLATGQIIPAPSVIKITGPKKAN